jgi:Cdc6-like AAA superfamily ATPase
MDQLDVKTLYDVIKLTAMPKSRLIIVGIANGLDFVERWLSDIVGPTPEPPLVFDAYDEANIFGIVDARVGPLRHTHRLISDAALRLCAGKAAKVGDARNALQFCRSALEELRSRMESDPSLVFAATATGVRYAIDIREMSDVIARVSGPRNPTGSLVTNLSLPDKLVLLSLFRCAGEVTNAQVLREYAQLCKAHSYSERSSQLVLQSLELLADAGLAVMNRGANVWSSTVALKVSPDDVKVAFQSDRTLNAML